MPEIAEPSVAVDDRRPLSSRDPRLTAWRAFLTAHALVWRRLDEDLRVEAGMSLAEYSALLQLAEAPDRRLRMNQLADGVFLSRSGVTRLIDRLETDGLVARSQCSSDGRGAEAVLTDDGFARLRAASPIHLRGIETYFLTRITPDELAAIERALGAVEERIRRDGRPLGASCAEPADAGPRGSGPA